MKSLKEQTAELYEQYRQVLSKADFDVIENATKGLIESGIGEKCLGVGDTVPSITLPNSKGNNVTIQDLLKKGPVVLSFYRGGWCTFCNLELSALQKSLPQIRELGAELVAITPEKPDGTDATLDELGLHYEILTDHGNRIASEFGLVFEVPDQLKRLYEEKISLRIPDHNSAADYSVPVTATYVIDRDGVIVAAFTDPDFTKRMEPSDVISAVSSLTATV